jgi:hypothetical protein
VPASPSSEASTARAPTRSSRNTAARPSAISGAMNDSAIASASGTRAIPQKKASAITVTTALRAAWMRSSRAPGSRGRDAA